MFQSFIFISYFLDLHKEQKRGKMQYLSQLISCPLAHLFSLSKETFVKNPCLKQDYVIHTSYNTVKPSCSKRLYKYCRETKTWSVVMVAYFHANFD